MEIYASLSLAMMHTEGSRERVREAFSRALDVAAIQGDSAYELRLLSGLFMYYRWNIDINAALDIASRAKEVALKTQDPDDMALTESMLGAANHLAEPRSSMPRSRNLPNGDSKERAFALSLIGSACNIR
jgi:hypothetical protein